MSDQWLSLRLIMSFDDVGSIDVDRSGIYTDHSLEQDNFKLRQLVYNDPYLNGAVTMEFWRDLESPNWKSNADYIEQTFRTFVKYSNYRLFSVEHFKQHSLCKFDLPKTEEPIKPNMPTDLVWLTDVINNKVK